VGTPATELKYICLAVFREVRGILDECKRAKTFASIDDADLRSSPWLGADLQTMGGHTGFATMFSRKTTSDPCAQLVHRVVYHRGDVYSMPSGTPAGVTNPKPFSPTDTPHETLKLKDDDAMWLLYQGCCSAPKRYMCKISESVEKSAKTQQSRTAARHHAVSGAVGVVKRSPLAPLGGFVGSGASASPLPDWIRSVLSESGRCYTERKDSAHSYLKQLLSLMAFKSDNDGDAVKGCEQEGNWIAVHIDNGAMPCPTQLSQDPPVQHRHLNNGVILAVNSEDNGEVVYARCTACKHCVNVNEIAERITKGGEQTPWVRFTRENLCALMQAAGYRHTTPIGGHGLYILNAFKA
jgi:hypothetical protein